MLGRLRRSALLTTTLLVLAVAVHATVSSTTTRNDYTGTGAVATYAYTFKALAATDLRVTKRETSSGNETTLVLNTDYTVTGVGAGVGGSITLTAGNLPSTHTLTIRRVLPLTQGTDLRNQSPFYAETHENVFDRLTMIDQQQQDDISRAIRIPESVSSSAFSTLLPATIVSASGKYVAVNSSGTGLELIPANAGSAFTSPALTGTVTGGAIYDNIVPELASSTIAGLPTCNTGATNQLRVVTDGIRGIWRCNGTAWLSVTGYADVRDFVTGGSGTSGSPWTGWESGIAALPAEVGVYWKPGDYFGHNGNVSLGPDALKALTTGTNNVAFGQNAMTATTTGYQNVAVGRNGLNGNTTGFLNVAIGMNALLSNTTGAHNTAVGGNALYSNVSADSNTAFGKNTLYSNTAGISNVAVGTNALYTNTASNNTAVGSDALRYNTTATGNTALGYFALQNNTTGFSNTAIGLQALLANLTGDDNVALGVSALTTNTAGNANLAIGTEALNLATGSNNTAVGYTAGSAQTTGSNNTLIGSGAAPTTNGTSNEVTLGNANVTNFRVPGIALSATAALLQYGGGIQPTVNGSIDTFTNSAASRIRVVLTANLPAAGAAQDGNILIEDGGAGDRNLIIYGGGQRFRIDGGVAF